MGLCEVLFVIFLVLKLVGVISWPWLVVFSPLFAGIVLIIVLVALRIMLD